MGPLPEGVVPLRRLGAVQFRALHGQQPAPDARMGVRRHRPRVRSALTTHSPLVSQLSHATRRDCGRCAALRRTSGRRQRESQAAVEPPDARRLDQTLYEQFYSAPPTIDILVSNCRYVE